eukprot:XP_023988118.1 galectin-7-like isoform X1 [Physeter catodon]
MAGTADRQWRSYSVPYTTPLPEGFEVGTVLRIRGVVNQEADRFHVNLMCSDETDSEIVLHFNPRLAESTVVINTMECGAWGSEERVLGGAFHRGQPFDLPTIAMHECFKVVVGDSESHEFIYRLPPKRARCLEVGGDVKLDLVKIF